MKISYKKLSGFILLIFILSPFLSPSQEKPKGKEWIIPEKEAMKKSEIKFDSDAIKQGKDIWAQNCKSCHGARGLGDGPKAEKIDISCGDFSSKKTQELSDGSLYWITTNGRKPMPSFKEKLSDTERWQLIAFIRTLGSGGVQSAPAVKGKESITQEKEKTVKKDTAAASVSLNKPAPETMTKPESLTTLSPEYLELKKEIEILKKELKAVNNRLDSIIEEKQKK